MEILTCSRSRPLLSAVIWRTAFVSLILAAGQEVIAGSDQPLDEYQVKAAFIYNFAKFVQWPSRTFQNATEPFTICIVGQDPFGRSLEDTVAGRTIENHPLALRHVSSGKPAVGCQILFIESTESKRPGTAPVDAHAIGVLTIGDSDAASGAVINFRIEGGKVRFDINIEVADRARLRISSRLLSLAHIVESGPK